MIEGLEVNTGKKRELETVVVDTYVILDMDRNIFDSDAKVNVQCALLTDHGVSRADANEALVFIRGSKGNSLAEDGFLRGLFGDEAVDAVHMDMLELAKTDEDFRNTILYGGATIRLLDALRSNGYQYGVYTFGEHANQRRKIELLHAMTNTTDETLPAVITTERYKGLQAASWIKDGLIEIPEALSNGERLLARTIVIMDDNKSNLLTDGVSSVVGVHTNNHGDTSEGQRSLVYVVEELESGHSILELARPYELIDK